MDGLVPVAVGRNEEDNLVVAFQCPWCHHNTTTFPQGEATRGTDLWLLVQCQNQQLCGRAALVEVTRFESPVARMRGRTVDVFENARLYPSPHSTYSGPGVPKEIAEDFQEAISCRTAGFRYGAALVARRVLQAAIRHVGGTGKDLRDEIASLPPETLAVTLRDAATQVRMIGNDAAHVRTVTDDDVDHLLRFTTQVLHFLFVLPDQVATAEAKRKPT